MEALFLKIVNISITASYLVLALIVLRPFLKKMPHWLRAGLWALPAFRLMLPRSLESVLSLIPSTQPLPEDFVYAARPWIHSGIRSVDAVINPVLSESMAPSPGASINPSQVFSFVLSHIWAIGAVLMLLYAFVSWAVLRQRMASSVRLQDNIYESDRTGSPFVLGMFRPRVYLPFGIPEADKPHVIAHELAHIRRKDHWWKPLGFGLLSIHWLNPFMWLSFVLFCRDIEAACDEKVIKNLDRSARQSYSRALLNCAVRHRAIAACPLAFGEVGVKTRIKSVMHYKKPALWLLVAGLLIGGAGAVFFLTDPPEATVKNPWVQEYIPGQGNTLGNVDKASFETVSPDFAIGADRYGRAVFKDPHKAFEAFLVECASGIEIIRQEMGLAEISPTEFELYKKYGWQVTWGTASQREMARFVTKFLDIYENSFLEAPPDTSYMPPVTQEPKLLTINDVILLSGKGNALTLSDLDGYAWSDYTHLGIGLDAGQDNLIRIFEINERFRLEVVLRNGNAENFLLVHIPSMCTADIRKGNVADFVSSHKRSLQCVDISYWKGYTCLSLPREYELLCDALEACENVLVPVTDSDRISEITADPYTFYHLSFNNPEETVAVSISLDGCWLWVEEQQLYQLPEPEKLVAALEALTDSVRNEQTSGIPFATADTPWDWAKGINADVLTDGKISVVQSVVWDGVKTTTTSASGTLAARRLQELLDLLHDLERSNFVPGRQLGKVSGHEAVYGGPEGSASILLLDGVNPLAAVLRYTVGKVELILTEETEKFREDYSYLAAASVWEIRDEALLSYMAELFSHPPVVNHTVGSEYEWYGPVEKKWKAGKLSLYLIEDWIYEEVSEETHSGIRFRPASEKEGWIYCGFWPEGYQTEEEDRHYSEWTFNGNVWITSYPPESRVPEDRIWSCSLLHTDSGDYVILNEGADEWFLMYEDQITDTVSMCCSRMEISE